MESASEKSAILQYHIAPRISMAVPLRRKDYCPPVSSNQTTVQLCQCSIPSIPCPSLVLPAGSAMESFSITCRLFIVLQTFSLAGTTTTHTHTHTQKKKNQKKKKKTLWWLYIRSRRSIKSYILLIQSNAIETIGQQPEQHIHCRAANYNLATLTHPYTQLASICQSVAGCQHTVRA